MYFRLIQESSSKSIPIMLCGNKTDLRLDYTSEGKTVISAESGRKLARVSVPTPELMMNTFRLFVN